MAQVRQGVGQSRLGRARRRLCVGEAARKSVALLTEASSHGHAASPDLQRRAHALTPHSADADAMTEARPDRLHGVRCSYPLSGLFLLTTRGTPNTPPFFTEKTAADPRTRPHYFNDVLAGEKKIRRRKTFSKRHRDGCCSRGDVRAGPWRRAKAQGACGWLVWAGRGAVGPGWGRFLARSAGHGDPAARPAKGPNDT